MSSEFSTCDSPSEVVVRVLECIRAGQAMPFSRSADNPYAGRVGRLSFLFEGEEDLLHVSVSGDPPPTPLEAQEALGKILPNVPPGLIRVWPGEKSIHFYLGHDDLLAHIQLDEL